MNPVSFIFIVHFNSSLSVVLNSTAGVLLEDIFKGCFKGRPSEAAASIIVKSSILILGCMAMVLLLVVDKLGGILEVIVLQFYTETLIIVILLIFPIHSWPHHCQPLQLVLHLVSLLWEC